MNLLEYQKEWEKDTEIDKTSLDDESLKIPKLHSKWMNFLSNERMIYKTLLRKKESTMLKLFDYYSGFLDGKEIGREPWSYKTETKSGIQKRVETDELIIKMQKVIDEKEEIVLFIKEIVTSINFRNNTLKNAIDFIKWSQGY